jgi:hypothetical protein
MTADADTSCGLVEPASAHMSNVLIKLIDAGKISTLDDLRSAYRMAVMRTHPDAAGSDIHLERYLALRKEYEDAKSHISAFMQNQPLAPEERKTSHRLAFFQHLRIIESLEVPYAFHPEENVESLRAAKEAAADEISGWNLELGELYKKADQEYMRIKREKPMGPYLKHALALNIRPVFHNIIAFHLTGRNLYAKQARQNLSGIMHQLAENGCRALKEFLLLLMADLKNGPAALE